jgi:hypothetical protein
MNQAGLHNRYEEFKGNWHTLTLYERGEHIIAAQARDLIHAPSSEPAF